MADSIEALKEKVKNEFLPWDDNKIPKEKEIPKVKKHTPRDDTPYRVSGTWVKSIYKQYD